VGADAVSSLSFADVPAKARRVLLEASTLRVAFSIALASQNRADEAAAEMAALSPAAVDEAISAAAAAAGLTAAFAALRTRAVAVSGYDAGVLLSATELTVGARASFADLYSVSLASRPLANVRVALEIFDAVDAALSPESLLFSAGADWADAQTVTVTSTAATAGAFTVRQEVTSLDAAYDAFALGDVRVAVAVSLDGSPPPKLHRARFLDNGAGLLVQFGSPTDGAGLSPSQHVFACSALFENVAAFGCKADGADGDCRCEWAAGARVNVTVSFGSGASLVPYGDLSTSGFDAVTIKAGYIKATSASTLYARAQTTPALGPLSPVEPAVAISAPYSVGLCDTVLLDAAGATGAGSRRLSYAWALQVETVAVAVDTAELAAVVSTANARGDVSSLRLPSAALTPTATYFASVTATNYLGETATAMHRFFKSPVPVPAIHFEKAAMSMYRTEAKTVLTVVYLPDLCDSSLSLDDLKLVYTWRVDSSDPRAGLSQQQISAFTAYPTTMRLPANTLKASTSYLVSCTVAFRYAPQISTTASTRITVNSGNLVAAIKGGVVEQPLAADKRLTLDGSDSTDPDATADALVYAWACDSAGTAPKAGISFYEVGAATATTSTNFAKVDVVFDARHGGARLTCMLVVSKPGRTAVAASTDVLVSADVAMPVVRVTSAISAKYNPSAGTFAAIAFDFASSDSNRTGCATRWSSLDAPPGVFSKAVTASSPMLIDLGFAEPHAVYNLRLTATDSLGSSSYAVIELTMNAPPTSGVFTVWPASGAPLVTVFRLEMAQWSDDEGDLPFTYGFSYAAQARYVSLVADWYSSSWLDARLPAEASSIAVRGRVYDRFGAFAAASADVELVAVALSAADLKALSESLVGDALATSSGSDLLSIITAVASLVISSYANATLTESDVEAYQCLVESLMAAVVTAIALVGTADSTFARNQALAALDRLTASPSLLTNTSQLGALDALTAVLSTAPALDVDAAAAAANAASHLLDGSLFAAVQAGNLVARAVGRRRRLLAPSAAPSEAPSAAPTALPDGVLVSEAGGFDSSAANQLVDIIASTAAAMIADLFGGQSRSVAAKNLELGAWRTDCGTRASGYSLGQGGHVIVPASVLDGVAGGSCADAYVDVRVAHIKNVYPLDDATGALVQVELGARAKTVAVDAAADPILITIDTLEYEATFAPDFDSSAPALQRNGTCFNSSQVLAFDDCPYGAAVHNCSEPLTGTYPNGLNVTLWAPPRGLSPLAVLVTCPFPLPQCPFWDRGVNDWSGAGCSVYAATPWNVTCACTHLTDFATQSRATASTARAVVKALGGLSLAALLEVMLILISLIALVAVVVMACCHGRKLDAADRAKRLEALQAERLEQFQVGGLYDDVGNIDVADFLGPAEQQILVARWRADQARGWLYRDRGDAFKAYSRAVEPSSLTNVGDFVWSMKREHKVLQVFYLNDGTFTRQERIFVLCVMIFTNLFVQTFLIQFKPLDTGADALSWPVVQEKCRYTLLSSVCSALLNIPVAAAFKYARAIDGAPSTASRVDHLLYANKDEDGVVDDVARGELSLRLVVLQALTKVHEAKAAQKIAAKALLTEYARTCNTPERVVTAPWVKAPTALERFAAIHEATSENYSNNVAFAERAARDAEVALREAVKEHSGRKHVLSLDEQALLEAEDAETKRALSWLARKVWMRFISPLRSSLSLGRAPKSPLPRAAGPLLCLACFALCCGSFAYVCGFAIAVNGCAACDPPSEEVDFCLSPDRDSTDPFRRCDATACAGALVNYCGHGARATSLAWLEMVVASIILTLGISQAFEVYFRSALANAALKRCLGAEALSARIQATARRIREKQRAGPASPDRLLGACAESKELFDAYEGDVHVKLALPREVLRAGQLRSPAKNRGVHPVEADCIPSYSDSLRDLNRVRDVERTALWRCPCGLECSPQRRQAHLRDCGEFHDVWHAAIVGFLAVSGPAESARAVRAVSAKAKCSADVALCALAESRGVEDLALEKLRHAAYRTELSVIEMGIVSMTARLVKSADDFFGDEAH